PSTIPVRCPMRVRASIVRLTLPCVGCPPLRTAQIKAQASCSCVSIRWRGKSVHSDGFSCCIVIAPRCHIPYRCYLVNSPKNNGFFIGDNLSCIGQEIYG